MRNPQLDTAAEEASERSIEINHSLLPPIERPYPWLLDCHSRGGTQIFFAVEESSCNKIHERSIPELRDRRVIAVCHGWFVLSDQGTAHEYSLWNISTLQSIILPRLKLTRNFEFGSCVLSSPPDMISSTILLFEANQANIMFLRIGRGHQQWIEMQCTEQLGRTSCQHMDDFIAYSACCNQEIYVATYYREKLLKVDLDLADDEDLNTKIVLTPLETQLPTGQIYSNWRSTFLVESLGQLFVIYVFYGGVKDQEVIAVEVHKLDLCQKQWEKVDNIKDQVFFLGKPNSVSCAALSEIYKGRIYFDNYSYRTEDKSLSVAFRWTDLSMPTCSSSIWVLPNNNRIRDDQAKGKNEVSKEAAIEGKDQYTLIDPKFSGRYFMRIPEELRDATIHCTKDGWLLMSRYDGSMFFFNPFTKAILHCPPLSLGCQATSYLMSSAPTSSNYLVMAITAAGAGVRQYSIRNGDQKWRCTECDTGSHFVPNHNSPILHYDESYYFLGKKGNLFRLGFEDGAWDHEVVEELQEPCESFHQNFLVECDEEAYSIFVGDHGNWVRVFIYGWSDDEDIRIVREVESIGNWTMFLSRSSCFAMEAVSEEMADRIYFPRLNKGSLVFYSLKTGKFHSSDGEVSLLDYACTTEQLLCCWTESRWN